MLIHSKTWKINSVSYFLGPVIHQYFFKKLEIKFYGMESTRNSQRMHSSEVGKFIWGIISRRKVTNMLNLMGNSEYKLIIIRFDKQKQFQKSTNKSENVN